MIFPAAMDGGLGHVPTAVVPFGTSMSELRVWVHGAYDAKAEGFAPGGASFCTTA